MSKTDITPSGSVCPVFLDDTPRDPVEDPLIQELDPTDAPSKLTGIQKIVTTASLTPDESVALFDEPDVLTIPTTDSAGGGVLYTQGGSLKWRGPSGTVVTIAKA